ncbi:MAG: PqqD family protein [Alistipes sp.]
MKIRDEFKVREMAGEQVVIMQGRFGADMTKVVALNESSLFLWNELQGREFDAAEVVRLLTEHYDIDAMTAARDAAAWIAKLEACKLV